MSARDTTNRIIGVGLVGYGYGGSVFHAPVIARVPGLQLRAIVERSGDLARRDYRSVAICRSCDELVKRDDVDLVVVSTPNATHFPIGRLALEAGKHVVIDKPMTINSAEALQLKAIGQAKHLILSPYHNRRWDRSFRGVEQLLRERQGGAITKFSSYFDLYQPSPMTHSWRERPGPGTGLLYDLGSHLLDQTFVLFGEPTSIHAKLLREREGTLIDDAFTITLAYNGFQAILGASLVQKFPRQRFAVSTTKGVRTVDSTSITHRLVPLLGRFKEYRWFRKLAASASSYHLYYENIRDAIFGRTSLAVTPDDGWRVVRAIELAIESDRLKTAVPWCD
jgi:scyllo-inositol 2-dehydrogenase (NADP+)